MIKQLLKYVEVEWKPLGSVLTRTKGTPITAGQMKILHKDNATLKIFAGGKTYALVDYDDIPTKDVNREPSIIVKSRGVIEFEYYDKPFSHKNEMWSYYSPTATIDIKYIYYYLKMQEPYFRNLGAKMQMPQIATPDTDKFSVPIPPISVQKEIVRILDAFTALTQELTKELTARKKQYNYYRDNLLSFQQGDVEWKTLGEVAEIGTGSSNTNEALKEGRFPFFVRSQEVRFKNSFEFDETAIITSGDGVGVGKIFHFVQGKYALHQRAYRIRVSNSELIPRFLFYFMKNNFLSYMNNTAVHASVTSVRKPMLEKYPIPIPPLAEQERIVAILDKFDALTTSISDGLPREIALRQKQYEYYRDLLLNFPKPDAA